MIGSIGVIFVSAGALLLSAQYRQISAGGSSRLRQHRSNAPALADLLNYAALVDDGVVVGKNGSFIASWLYEGDDNASSTDEQRELTSMLINQVLSRMGNGWMIHVDAVRRPAPTYSDPGLSHFPDPVSSAIDEERRRHFQGAGAMYEGYFILTATYFPPMLAQSKFVELMFDDEAKSPGHKARTQGLIDAFHRDCATLESRLSSALRLHRLRATKIQNEDGTTVTHDDMLRWLQFCVTGLNHPIVLPSNPMYLDTIIGGQELFGGVIPKIGRKFITVVAIEGFPLESTPGILSALGELPCEYRWSSRYIFMEAHEAVKHLDKFRKKWKQKIRGFIDQIFHTNSGAVDHDAISMVADAEAAIAEGNSGIVSQGYYTSVVVLMNEDREVLQAAARQVEKAINRLGFAARVESINTLDAYLGSLPGHGVENVRRPLINTMNLADLLPTSSIWMGVNRAPCLHYPPMAPALMQCATIGATPFHLNLHVADLGHTLLFGRTRSGKSTHLGLIAAQLRRYAGMSIFVFEKGMSMYPLAKAVGGRHFEVAADSDALAFCPLQFLATKGDRAWAMEWIDTILALNNVVTTPAQRNEIGNAIISMKENGAKTMSEFSVTIQSAEIRAALQQYTVDGGMGHLLDADEDGLALADFTVFEIGELMELGEKYALPTLLYLFRRIERTLTGQPAAIILDEAWLMLGHPVFRQKLRVWLKGLAKANCLVIMATQSLTDAADSGILDVIVESTATKIFLPNVYARDEDTAALYHRMGLNNRQIDIVANAIPKRQYYYVSESGRRLYDLALGPLALAFVGATDKESLATIKALEAKHGADWIKPWLAMRDLDLKNYGSVA